MFSSERIQRLERLLLSGSVVEQTVAAQVVAEACESSAIDAHQFAQTVVSLLTSERVQGDAARVNLLVALLACHRALAVSFDQTRDILFSLLSQECARRDGDADQESGVFILKLIDEGAEFAGAGETGMLAAIAEAHPSASVRACALNSLARIQPSLCKRWDKTLPDQVTPRPVRLRALKDALFTYGDAEMAAQAIFNCVKGDRIVRDDDAVLTVLQFAAEDSNCTLQLAASLSVLMAGDCGLTRWQQALNVVAHMTVASAVPGRYVSEAAEILHYVRSRRSEAARYIEDAIVRVNESFIARFNSADEKAGHLSPVVSKKEGQRLYTDGNGFCLTVNC